MNNIKYTQEGEQMKNKMSLHHDGVVVKTSTMKPQPPWF